MQYGDVDHFQWFCVTYLGITMFDYQLRWFEHFMQGRWAILLAPRSHGKSTFMVCLLVYIICFDPTIRILICSDKEDLANQFSRDVQNFIEYIQVEFPDDFPFLKDKPWKLKEWYLRPTTGKKQRHPTVSTSAGRAGITGRRFDILVFDDILQSENVSDEYQRKRMERWIRTEVLPTQDRSAKEKRLIIGTRKHPDDWYGKLLQNRFYTSMIDHLYIDSEEGRTYLWPYDKETETGWNDEVVERVKEDYKHNMTEFFQEYFNEPSPPHGIYFKLEWLSDHYYKVLPPSNRLTYYMGVDPSMGANSRTASWLAIAVIAFDYIEQVIYVVDLYRGKMPIAEHAAVIKSYYHKWKPESTNMETCMVNEYFSEQVIRELPNIYPINHREHRLRGSSDISKEGRIENIIGVHFKNGVVRFPDPELSPMTLEFLEYEYLPFPDKKSAKDMLDALNMAVDLIEWKSYISDGPLFYTVS
jgi:hypothetical protein